MWALPFALILLLPFLTGSLTFAMSDALRRNLNCPARTYHNMHAAMFNRPSYVCPGPSVVVALLPGLLDLLPVFWLLSTSAFVRRAALWLVKTRCDDRRLYFDSGLDGDAVGPEENYDGVWNRAFLCRWNQRTI